VRKKEEKEHKENENVEKERKQLLIDTMKLRELKRK
jgi:hypothetical protein